jgi:hypothetical protein
MSELIFVLGLPASGKSTSIGRIDEPESGIKIEGLPPENTVIISVEGKPLPWRGWMKDYNIEKKNYFEKVFNVLAIRSSLQALTDKEKYPHIKYIVIDDFQSVISEKFINDLKRKSGGDAFEKYNEILVLVRDMFRYDCKNMRSDQKVFVLSHLEEYNENGRIKTRFQAVGNATHRYLKPESLATIVLYAEGKMEGQKITRYFRTQGDGVHDVCRSPIGMFPKLEIPNDLGYVVKQIDKYYKGE